MQKMNNISKKNRGFNLIDLMMVVALVGVLATIAIPSYQAYSVRTKVSEGITAANPLKDEMAYYYTVNGRFPSSDHDLGIQASHYASDIVQSISINAQGNLVATFNSIDKLINEGESIEFQHSLNGSGAIEWICTPSDIGGVKLRYVPASCRNS